MATEQNVYDRSYKAAANLSAKQHYIVEMTGTDQVNACDNAADRAIGVLQNDPLQNEEATVRHLGVSKVVVDGTANGGIAVMSPIGTDATGKGVKKSTDKDWIIGFALDAATANGVVIRVLMMPQGIHV